MNENLNSNHPNIIHEEIMKAIASKDVLVVSRLIELNILRSHQSKIATLLLKHCGVPEWENIDNLIVLAMQDINSTLLIAITRLFTNVFTAKTQKEREKLIFDITYSCANTTRSILRLRILLTLNVSLHKSGNEVFKFALENKQVNIIQFLAENGCFAADKATLDNKFIALLQEQIPFFSGMYFRRMNNVIEYTTLLKDKFLPASENDSLLQRELAHLLALPYIKEHVLINEQPSSPLL